MLSPASTESGSQHLRPSSSQPFSQTTTSSAVPCSLQVWRSLSTHLTSLGLQRAQFSWTSGSRSVQSVPVPRNLFSDQTARASRMTISEAVGSVLELRGGGSHAHLVGRHLDQGRAIG